MGTDGRTGKEGDIEDDVLNGSTGADQDADGQIHQRHLTLDSRDLEQPTASSMNTNKGPWRRRVLRVLLLDTLNLSIAARQGFT